MARLLRSKWIWFLLGLLSLTLRAVIPSHIIENYYSRGLFPQIRTCLDSIFPKFHFAPFYIFWVFSFLLILFSSRHLFSKAGLQIRLWKFGSSILNLFGAVVFFFMFLWGFNYKRIPISTQLSLSTTPLNLEEIKSELDYQTNLITTLRQNIPELTPSNSIIPAYSIVLPYDIENKMRTSLKYVLTKNNFPARGNVNIRVLKPKGILFGFHASGIYLPYTGEGHVESALHPLQLPFVMAHEMAHGYGFGDEGTCNFWAYLSCISSENPFVRYTGHLAYWRYLASEWKRNEPDQYQKYRDNLPPPIRRDLNSISESIIAYPSFFGSKKNLVYDSFLKAQGIDSGLENYNVVIPMVKSYWDNLKLHK